MGRSSGGGGHSSGGFGGGRSSGGFSGGGRSSGGFSGGRSHHSPLGGGYSPFGRPHFHNSFHFHSGWGWGPRPPRMGYGCLSPFISIFVIIIVLWVVIAASASSNRNNNSNIPENTKERVALSGAVDKTNWYQDGIGWITNERVLINGLEEFYNQTGIQPYILFVPYSTNYWNGANINANAADAYLETVYNSTFTDEAHFIFAYFESSNDSKAEMEGEFRYLSGYSADTIMDDEAIRILWGYFEKNYYDTSLSIEEMISNTFSETATAIMSKPTNGWDFAKVLIGIIGVIVVVFILYKILKNKNKRDKEKEEYTKEILNQPLETFGKDTSDLEDKYK